MARERRGDPVAGRADRQRRLDGHGGARLQTGADVGQHRVERAEVRTGVGVDDQRRHRDDELGAAGHRLRWCRSVARRRPAPTTSASASASPSSPGNGGCAALTRSTGDRVDVAADHLVAGAGDLGGERQADLAQRDDDRLQRPPRGARSRRSRRCASAASATSTVSSPSASGHHRRVGVPARAGRRTPRARPAAARGGPARSASCRPRRRRAATGCRSHSDATSPFS